MNYLDVLSKLGIGSAHPGGFAATLDQLRHFPIPEGARILEVGCGTGRTTCHLAGLGYDIIGLDLREDMLKKARDRAGKLELDVAFVQGDACALPFDGETFDVVMCESVTNFADAGKALSEYYRVLKSGGVLYDREMMILKPLPDDQLTRIYQFFGMESAYSPDGWIDLLASVGFKESSVWKPSTFPEHLADDVPDGFEAPDAGTLLDARVWQFMHEHDDIIVSNKESLGFGVMVAHKP
ncbi:class I SAM-dependent methyltransferase [Paenibacillus hamazuiensis]|uniref:class I SAM-dependent methyltransferase n=1 Tax=Paenibacillus hamazuiensis TaxID=2936508 RepID=UPI00200E107A|nr:methyltransferase domain-containing protein [Paenibacillus hamazuiensis]